MGLIATNESSAAAADTMDQKKSSFKTIARQSLQTLAAAGWIVLLAFGGPICLCLTVYLVLFTTYRWAMLVYFAWILIDRRTCEFGGRRSEWARNWTWWRHFRDYFPVRLVKASGFVLDPEKNYLFCSFPHGIIPAGPFCASVYADGGFGDFFPHHTPYPFTLAINFYLPFFRELCLALGTCSASARSIKYLLSNPAGGNAGVLSVGGASEAYCCKPGQYKLVLKRRKGFVRLALQTGAPLVPMFSFGETELFDQAEHPSGSRTRAFQEFVRRLTGIAPIIPLGRGLSENSTGIIPRRRPLTVLFGKPVNVEKVEDPTEEEINAVHEKFVNQLVDLFEQNKHRYIENAENTHLIIT